jgi:hypothetical protein
MTKNKKLLTSSKVLSMLVMTALFASNTGSIVPVFAQEAPATVQVTISKYTGDQMATAETAGESDFQMSATWNAENIGAGTGAYALSSPSYQTATAEMSEGASYSTNEEFDDVVGVSCTAETPFALVGYTSGETLSEAENATPSLTPPSFTNLMTDKFVIVWNEDCTPPVVDEPTSQVQINKYIDGEQATSETADNSDFLMNATWESTSHGAGTGQYTLNESNDPTAYQESTVEFNDGANYTTSEVVDGMIVSASCTTESMYELVGYTSGETLSEAENATPSLTPPSFTNLMTDKYVIVWNDTCVDENEGTIGGDVTGGTNPNGDLEVTSIETIDGTATADGSFENGWEYVFNITVPTDETELSMKFSDWINTANTSNTIPVANNMRISSLQANNGNATVLLTAANTYSIPTLDMVTDLDAIAPGLQVEVKVEVAIPSNTVNGSYTTNYGVQTTI